MVQADVDSGVREGLTRLEREELVRLRRENRVLRMEKSRRIAHDSTRVVGTLRGRASTSESMAKMGVEPSNSTGFAPNFARWASR